MSVRAVSRSLGRLVLTLGLAGAGVVGIGVPPASTAPFGARASVDPNVEYLGDAPGQVFTFTVENTGTSESIGAVEIDRPSKSWTIADCPLAPTGWTVQRSDTMCRYRSAGTPADDLAAGASSSAFQVRAYVGPDRQNLTGTWSVQVSRQDTFDRPSRLTAAAAVPPGLGVTAYSFQVLDVVVDPETTTPGAACPAPAKTAPAGSTGHTLVVCGRNRTTGTLTPTGSSSSLAGSFVAGHGAFSSGAVAPSTQSRILGSWSSVTIGAAGADKTVLARIGSANNRTSPVTRLDGYTATAVTANHPPVANDDAATVSEDADAQTVAVLGNDTDADGDALSVTAVDTTGTTGTVTNNGTDVSYDPNGAFDSLAPGASGTDTFTYTASDGHGGTDTATVTITVTAVDDPPVAVADSATVSQNASAAAVAVLANDTDVDGGPLAIASATDPANGTVVLTGGTPGAHTGLTYQPDPGYCSAAGPDTFTYTLNGGSTATVSVTVTCLVNSAPVAADDAANVGAGSTGTLVDVLANDTDADGDTLSVVAVDTTGTTGSVTNNGDSVSYDPQGAFDYLAAGQSATDTFTYTVSDAHGGTDTATVTITVDGTNDPPVIAGLESTALGYTENDAATAITGTGTVTDPDSADLDTGTLTVDYSAGGGTQDRLEIADQGVLPGQIGVAAGTVTYGGVPIGTFTGGTGTTALVVTFNSSATPAAAQALLRSITYRNVSETPSTAARTVRFVLTDGDGGTSAPATRDLTVTAVNDAPVAVDDTGSVAENATTTLDVLSNDTDADGDTLSVIAVDTTGTTGSVTNNGTDVSYDTNGAFDSLGAGETTTDTFTYTASDAHGGTDTATVTVTITGSAGNTAPVAADDAATVAASSTGSVIDVLGNDTDADADTLSVTAVDTTGTSGAVTNNGNNVSYDPNGAFDSLPEGESATDTFTYTVSDGHGGTDTATVTVTVNGTSHTNVAPVIAAIEPGALGYTENDAATAITATATVTDPDSANFDTGTLTVDLSVGGAAEDRLEIRNQGVLAGQIGVAGSTVSYGGVAIGTWTGGTGTTPLVVTLNAQATPAATEALVRDITYRNVSEAPSTASRTVRFVLTDGDGGTSAPATRSITVAAADDAPVVTTSIGTTAYTEQGTAVTADAALTVTDADSANAAGATVTIASVQAGDTLSFTPQGGITGGFAAGVLTLSGSASVADYQSVLRSVTFSNLTSDAPGSSRTLSFAITAPTASNSATKTITISQVNDAPTVSLDAAGALSYTEQAGFVNLFGPAATVTDPDSATLSSLSINLSSGYDGSFDSIRLNPTVVGFSGGFSNGVLTLSRAGGTPAEYTNALRNLQFANTNDDPDHRNDGTADPADAQRTVSVSASDGSASSGTVTRDITITPVNDAPSLPAIAPATTGVRNTTLVAGTTTSEPHVTRTVDLIGTATDPDGLESAIAITPIASAATTNGGRLTLGAGTLRYEPPFSTTITSDTASYTLTDGSAVSAPVTFTVNLSGSVVYVTDQAAAPAVEDGTTARPFDSLAEAIALTGSNTIYVRRGPGDGILTAGVTLGTGEKLIGEGVALTNTDVGSVNAETIYAAGTKPVLTASGTDVVTLAANAQVAGVSINPDGAANGLFGTATAGVTLRSMDVTDTGTAATQPGIELTGTGNGLTFTAPVSLSTTQAGALSVSGAALTGTLASVTVTGSTTSPGVNLVNTTGSLTFTTVALTTNGQPGFVLNNAASVDVLAGNVAATGRPAVDATALNVGSDLAFTDVDSTSSTTDGVNLDGTDTAWTFSAGAGSTLSGAAGIGFDVNNGTGAVSFAGTVASTTGKAADVSSRTGNTTFSGSFTGTGTGVIVTGNSGGTTTFSGATKTFSTGASTAVDLTANTGSTVAFTNGGLAITTSSATGFNATGGGTVTVAGTNNTVTSTTGTAVNVSATTIGAAGLVFRSVSANGAASGIVLASTGTTGGLSVTGTGVADSGGTIANTSGPGVSLTNTDLVSFNNLKIQGANRSGVRGVGVTGFSFTNGTIANAGDTLVDTNDSALAFNDTVGGTNNNLDGAVTITGNTLSNAYGGGVDIFNYAGTISNAVITGNTVSSSADPALSKRSGIALNLFGSATTVASLTKATISNNTVTNFPNGDGINVQGANTASSTAPAGTYGTPGSATNVVTMSGNQVIGDATNKLNGFGIAASVTGRGQGNFAITNNGTVASPLRNMKSSAVAIGAAGNVTTNFTVTGNQISANNGFNSPGLALGTDKNIQADLSTLSSPAIRATITGNAIANTSGPGIRVLHRDSNGSLNLRVDNNTVTSVQGSSGGIRVENGSSGNASFNPTMCASISGNSAATGPPDGFGDGVPGIVLSKRSTSATTYVFGITGLSPSPATAAQTETYVTSLNPSSALGTGFYAGKRVAVVTGSNFTSCTLPSGV